MTANEATRVMATMLDGNYRGRSEAESKAAGHLGMADLYGRRTHWDAAKSCLDAAYRSLGAEPDAATGYDWHAGNHPVQVEARRHEAALSAALGE